MGKCLKSGFYWQATYWTGCQLGRVVWQLDYYTEGVILYLVFCHIHSTVIMHISNVYLLVLSKATGKTLQKQYDYDNDRKNKIHAPSFMQKNMSVGFLKQVSYFSNISLFDSKIQSPIVNLFIFICYIHISSIQFPIKVVKIAN